MTSMPRDTGSGLERLAAAVARLRPDWRSANAFYEQRSEITAALRSIARNPALVRTVIRFVPALCAALPPASSRTASPNTRLRRPVRRPRPLPGLAPAGQSVLGLEVP